MLHFGGFSKQLIVFSVYVYVKHPEKLHIQFISYAFPFLGWALRWTAALYTLVAVYRKCRIPLQTGIEVHYSNTGRNWVIPHKKRPSQKTRLNVISKKPLSLLSGNFISQYSAWVLKSCTIQHLSTTGLMQDAWNKNHITVGKLAEHI